MPKGFSEREKAIIRAKLLEKGRECFATYGIRRTSVEDLTGAAGISKGAFYLFFDSKEELFFEILGQFETEYQEDLLESAAQARGLPRRRVKDFLIKAFSLWQTHPLFRHFNQEEYEYLMRKLPEERFDANARKDEVFIDRLFELWRSQGVAIDCDPAVFQGLMRALFFVGLHEREVGQDVYPAVIELLIDLIAGRVVE